jgi:D-3-phosphoglycerate dehydrogenase
MTMNVVVTDWTFPDLGIEEQLLKSRGCQLISRQCTTESDLISLVADADAVITQAARITPTVINAMSRARGIVRYGVGFDRVDVAAAEALGIPVCNVPDYCTDEVADHTLAFILALTRQVVTHASHLSAGKWGFAVPLSGVQALRDMTVGVVGFGRIGREVVRRLNAFKCRIVVVDPSASPAEIARAGARPAGSLAEVLLESDVVTLHCPSTAETRKLINQVTLSKMKTGAVLINAARGDVVDTEALVKALNSGRLRGAALDVCDPEPIPEDHPLRSLDNVILSPHIAWASPPAMKRLREAVASQAAAAALGEMPPNVVNGIKVPRTF